MPFVFLFLMLICFKWKGIFMVLVCLILVMICGIFFLAWGFGFLSVTIISCASLLGAFVVPFMNQSFYKVLLLFMVSLAVGVLCGSGIFHLIPHVSICISKFKIHV